MTDSDTKNGASPLKEKSDLVSQTSHGTTLNEVASRLLQPALKERYTDLEIDPNVALVATPQWLVVEGSVQAGQLRFEVLTDVLVRQSLSGEKANYVEGEHFLTLDSKQKNPVCLAVSIEEIAGMLNDMAPFLFVELQARQLEFWNTKGKKIARWAELSDSLRKAMNVQQVPGWDVVECEMAREVFKDPDNTTRKNADANLSAIQACLIDIDTLNNDIPSHLVIGGALVLKATYRQRELLTMYTIERGYESFSSMTQLGQTLLARINDLLQGDDLDWRLYEPEGNIFDYMAWALVSAQLDAIDLLKFPEVSDADSVEPQAGLDTLDQARFEQLVASVPQWLGSASAHDIGDYSRYVTALGNLYREPAYKAARNKIPFISDHAQHLMHEAIIADPRAVDATSLALNELQINVTNSFTVNNLTLPNPLDHRVETLADFALENEAPYLATLSFKHGQPVPDWLTPSFLTSIAERINIGDAYLKLLKRTLVEDPQTSRQQENFYREQLRLLMPLTALEGKVRQRGGLDEQGYRYICNLFDPGPDGVADIAIYPLTMTPQHRLNSVSDTVENMFIIRPRKEENATCLLYRPLLDQPLLQFPSRQNLLYALHQPGELRDSVLAWLPNKSLSFEYAQYVFPVGLPSPWLITEQLINPLHRFDRFGRVVFESDEITGHVPAALFKSNAQALLTLADKQSQSNSERRWHLLKDSSWALFNVTTNLLSGTVGTAVWLWQTITQLQQAIDAHERADRFVEWASVADILLTVGIILSHHAVMRRNTLPQAIRGLEHAKRPEIERTPTIVNLRPAVLGGELAPVHCRSLELAGTVPRRTSTALAAYLDTLSVDAPDLTDNDLSTLGDAPPHLYQLNQKTYARVAERWFNAVVDAEEQVSIVHADDPLRLGPLLAQTRAGEWVLDLRLRLRGGGPKNRLKLLKAEKEHRKRELENTLRSFKAQEASKDAELKKIQAEMFSENNAIYDEQSARYIEKLEEMINAFQQALEQFREWRSLGGTVGYTYDLLRMSTEQQKYLALWFTVKKHRYIAASNALSQDSGPDRLPLHKYIEKIQLTNGLSDQMVEKFEISRNTLEGMSAAGRSGVTEALKIGRLLPSFTALQLKANEIGMAQELCMQEQASSSMDEARNSIGSIIVATANAAHTVAERMKADRTTSDLPPAIETFSGIVDVFADANQRLQELPDAYPGLFKQPQLDRLHSLFTEFSELAQNRLQSLLPESEIPDTQQSLERGHPPLPRATIKVSKSRPRNPVESQAPKTTDAPFKPFTPGTRHQPVQRLDDAEVIEVGLKLNSGAESFIKHCRKDAARPGRIPTEMQDLFNQQAVKLEQSATRVDQVMARTNNELPVGALSSEMRQAAKKMRTQGIAVRADMYQQRKPTQSSFQWMHENQQVDVFRNSQGRIKTKQLGDYFQEYRILDKTHGGRELWVAHFHYETFKSSANHPTAAHLKVSDTFLKTLTAEHQAALVTFEPIDGALRKLDDPELRKLFLDLEPKNAKSG